MFGLFAFRFVGGWGLGCLDFWVGWVGIIGLPGFSGFSLYG